MIDPLLTQTAERVFADTCGFDAVERAEEEGWAPEIWQAVAETGLPWVSVPETASGSGGTTGDALEILRVAGRHSAPIPLGETGMLAGWLAAEAGCAVPEGPATVAPGTDLDTVALARGELTGRVHRVPWARAAERIVVLVDDAGALVVASVRGSDVHIEPATNLAGEPRDTVVFDGVAAAEVQPAPSTLSRAALHARGAMTRVALITGALERMCEVTLDYTNQREQFGKRVASFQAVQEHLVRVAQDAAMVRLALHAAAAAMERGAWSFEVAAAKTVANQAASTATRHAHQAHGAMGMTREYSLHHLSRRLWSWRSEFGSERSWSRALGDAIVAAGADAFYPAITGGSRAVEV